MSETVIRHRGGGYDDNGDPIESTSTTLRARAVAPGATAEYQDRGRDGKTIAFSVYFWPAVDLTDDDQLTVRDERFLVQVEQWVSPRSRRAGTVALCTRGEG